MGKAKPKDTPKKPRKPKPPPGPQPSENGQARPGFDGRKASDVVCKSVEFFWFPWVPASLLTLVVGQPCVGKSSFIAGLISMATGGPGIEDRVGPRTGKVILLPGHEEGIEAITVPRLKAAGARLERVILFDTPGTALVSHREKLAELARREKALLVVGDPIDSYVDEGFSENDGQAVRPTLEAAAWIASQSGAAVVFSRHPGKDLANVMPGSRQWRAVPRSVLQLTSDGGLPPKYLLSHYKDSLGTRSIPRHYSLLDTLDGPPRLVLGEEIDRSAEELSRAGQGPTSRFKLLVACRLIRWVFEQEEAPTRVYLGEEGRKIGIGEDTIYDAMRLLSVKSIPPLERGTPWRLHRMVEEWPAWLPTDRGGVGQSEGSEVVE